VSLVDWINRAFVSWLRRREPQAAVAGDILVIGDRRLPLTDLTGAIAYETDVHAGLALTLMLSFPGGKSVTVTELDPCWRDLIDALDRLGLTRAPSRDWLVELVAAGGRQPIVLRSGSDGALTYKL